MAVFSMSRPILRGTRRHSACPTENQLTMVSRHRRTTLLAADARCRSLWARACRSATDRIVGRFIDERTTREAVSARLMPRRDTGPGWPSTADWWARPVLARCRSADKTRRTTVALPTNWSPPAQRGQLACVAATTRTEASLLHALSSYAALSCHAAMTTWKLVRNYKWESGRSYWAFAPSKWQTPIALLHVCQSVPCLYRVHALLFLEHITVDLHATAWSPSQWSCGQTSARIRRALKWLMSPMRVRYIGCCSTLHTW